MDVERVTLDDKTMLKYDDGMLYLWTALSDKNSRPGAAGCVQHHFYLIFSVSMLWSCSLESVRRMALFCVIAK